MFSKEVPSKFLKSRDDRVSNPKPQKGKGTSSPNKMTTCGKCRKKHYDVCLIRMDNSFSYGKSVHKVRY